MTFSTQLEFVTDWADLDLFGHMNNVAFFRYIQAARVNFCRQSGLEVLNEGTGLSFTVAETKCSFKTPLRYGDKFTVSSRLLSKGNTSFRVEHVFVKEDGGEVATGNDVLVCFDHHAQTKNAIPAGVLAAWNS